MNKLESIETLVSNMMRLQEMDKEDVDKFKHIIQNEKMCNHWFSNINMLFKLKWLYNIK